MGTNERRKKQKKRHIGILLVLLVGLPTLFYQATSWAHRKGLARISFTTRSGETPPFYLEIAATPETRHRGLMYVRDLPKDEGMLFIFPAEKKQTFWMKNTFISLDLIFISQEKKVVGVLQNAPILTEERQSIPAQSMYVIELNGGVAKEFGIEEGSEVYFMTPLPRAVEDQRSVD
jgi:uncharacterized membrane protein (UPF0127 family)